MLLAAGACVLLGVWLGPLPRLAPGSFSAHMVMHMGVVAVAAPLIAFGIARGRWDPVRLAPRLLSPIPASVVELIAVWAWHAPALHHVARHSTLGLVVEQGTFLVAGLLVWLTAFGGPEEDRRARVGAGVVAMLLTSMHMTLLGALLALPPRALYDHGDGIASLTDQHLGGAIMLVAGGLAYLLGGLWLTAELLGAVGARAEPARSASR